MTVPLSDQRSRKMQIGIVSSIAMVFCDVTDGAPRQQSRCLLGLRRECALFRQILCGQVATKSSHIYSNEAESLDNELD